MKVSKPLHKFRNQGKISNQLGSGVARIPSRPYFHHRVGFTMSHDPSERWHRIKSFDSRFLILANFDPIKTFFDKLKRYFKMKKDFR